MRHEEKRIKIITHTCLQLCSAARRFDSRYLALIFTIGVLLFPDSALAFQPTLASNASRLTSVPVLQVNAGFDGRYRNGDWVPIHITLHNNGADFSGTLSTSNPLGPVQATSFTAVPVSTYQRPITLPHGSQQQVTMYLPINALFGTFSIPVQLLDQHGNIIQSQSASLQALNQEDVFVGLLSDQTTGIGPLQALALPSQSGSVVAQFLDAQTMPDMATVLANFNLI